MSAADASRWPSRVAVAAGRRVGRAGVPADLGPVHAGPTDVVPSPSCTSATRCPSGSSPTPTSPTTRRRSTRSTAGSASATCGWRSPAPARSIEHLDGQLGGEEVARKVRRNGFEGCWVVALGTNDAANVAVGSAYGYSERIDRMMAIIGDDPVLWVDVKTLRDRGPYASAEHAPVQPGAGQGPRPLPGRCGSTTGRDAVADQWFDGDGIHYTSDGYAYRVGADRRRRWPRLPDA